MVLAVVAPAENPVFDMSYHAFFGYDERGGEIVDAAGFAAMRLELLGAGHDSVDYEDGEQVILVALDPSSLRVAARLTPGEADELHELMAAMPDQQDDAGRMRLLEALVARRALGPVP